MCYGSADGNLDIVFKSLIKGIGLNATNYDGITALHKACHYGLARIVNLIISKPIPCNTFREASKFEAAEKHYNLALKFFSYF